jgi:hypothetical protein
MTALWGVKIQLVGYAEVRKIEKVTGAQDDGFFGGLEYSWLDTQKTRKIEKVTGSQDDIGKGDDSIESGY